MIVRESLHPADPTIFHTTKHKCINSKCCDERSRAVAKRKQQSHAAIYKLQQQDMATSVRATKVSD